MIFVWSIQYTLRYIFFKLAIYFIALMHLGESCQFKRRDLGTMWRTMLLLCFNHCYCMQQHYDVTQFEYVLWRHTIHEWVVNIHYKTWIAQGRFANTIITPRNNGACVINLIAASWGRDIVSLKADLYFPKSMLFCIKYHVIFEHFCNRT